MINLNTCSDVQTDPDSVDHAVLCCHFGGANVQGSGHRLITFNLKVAKALTRLSCPDPPQGAEYKQPARTSWAAHSGTGVGLQ